MAECDHDFQHQGMVACDGNNNLPGSGAVRRYYAHVYFCRRCLEKRYEAVPGDFNSYQGLQPGSVWGSDADRKNLVDKYEPSRWR